MKNKEAIKKAEKEICCHFSVTDEESQHCVNSPPSNPVGSAAQPAVTQEACRLERGAGQTHEKKIPGKKERTEMNVDEITEKPKRKTRYKPLETIADKDVKQLIRDNKA